MAKKTIEDIQVKGKKVLVRCDFNVPLDENKVITDENRIRGALPTIKYLMDHGARQGNVALQVGRRCAADQVVHAVLKAAGVEFHRA